MQLLYYMECQNTIMLLFLHPYTHNITQLYDMSKYSKFWSELYSLIVIIKQLFNKQD